jgi:hypothetical protein
MKPCQYFNGLNKYQTIRGIIFLAKTIYAVEFRVGQICLLNILFGENNMRNSTDKINRILISVYFNPINDDDFQ